MKKLALLLPLLALAAAGCGERSQYVAAEIERDITNPDHSESVEIRVPQSRKPLYYATTWLFCTEESSAEFYRDLTGPHYKSEFRHPDEGQWFINIYRVPELRGRPLLPLDFDDNGKISFTWCGTKVIYDLKQEEAMKVCLKKGEKLIFESNCLPERESRLLFERSGEIEEISIGIK